MGSVMCQDVDWIIIITIMKMNTIHKYTVRFRFQSLTLRLEKFSFEPPSLQHAKRRSD